MKIEIDLNKEIAENIATFFKNRTDIKITSKLKSVLKEHLLYAFKEDILSITSYLSFKNVSDKIIKELDSYFEHPALSVISSKITPREPFKTEGKPWVSGLGKYE